MNLNQCASPPEFIFNECVIVLSKVEGKVLLGKNTILIFEFFAIGLEKPLKNLSIFGFFHVKNLRDI